MQSLVENPSCRVVVVILNWNGKQYLEPCLHSVFSQKYQDWAVILVDNGSSDGSLDLVRTCFPQVRIIENKENRGFAAANNQAIRASASEFIATLNNDTEVEPGWLEALVQAMDTDSRIGMCASKMMLANRRDVVESAGIAVDKAGISWGIREESIGHLDEVKSRFVFGSCAGAALYRRSMLDDIGLFDEDFFAYLEDVDMAWRAQWADWKCAYVPESVVYHVHSATGKEGSPFKNRLLGRNKIWMLCKNYPSPSWLWYAPLILVYDLMAVGYAIATGRHGAVRGRIAAVLKIPAMLSKRRQVIRRISPQTMMARLHPVDNPLAILRRYAHIWTASLLQ